ncbi:MAG: Flp pilus assembly protein CpaB, partial [Pirellulales bacterium]|nr:Flp pilus assembly protein CpaB [Pirellulales bacterium]
MRAKSAILLLLALACGLVAAIGVTQVISRNAEPAVQQGDTRPIIVAVADIAPGELITPQMVKLEPWPKEKVPEDALSQIEKVDGCRARSEIYQGEPIREKKLLGQGFTRQTATDYIPKGYRVVGVKVDMVSGAGLIQPGDRVDVLVHLSRNVNKGILENRTQTVLQDIKVFAIDDIFRPDPAATEEDSMRAKVIQLLVTPDEAETLVLAQQLGKVQLTMRPPGGEEAVKTSGKTPGELFGEPAIGDRAKEEAGSKQWGQSGGGGMLDFLNNLGKKPAPVVKKSEPAEHVDDNSGNRWNMRIITGADL